jgi:putative membrane protein
VKRRRPQLPAGHEFADPTRRTYLAQERTLLAWWRTGLGTIAVAVAIGRLVPAVTKAPRAPFLWIGTGFGVLALAMIVFGTLRQREVTRSLAVGEYADLNPAVVLAMTVLMAVLTVAAIVVLFINI